MNSKKDFLNAIELMEHLCEKNALVFIDPKNSPFRYFSSKALLLNEKIDLKLEHMLRFSSLYIPSTYNPTFFMPEIYNNKRESFADIDSAVLENFVDQTLFRLSQGGVIFDHLQASFSKIHS